MPAGGGEGTEDDVTGGMPPAAQALLTLFCLGGRTDGWGGNSYPEKDNQLPGHKVAAMLLKYVQIRQE